MRCRPLALALSIALLPAAAQAEDLLQTYQLARASDPQLAAAEAGQRATAEGEVQTRAQMLPQINGSVSADRSRSTSKSGDAQYDPITGQLISGGSRTSTSDTLSARIGARQMVWDPVLKSQHRAQQLHTRAGELQLEFTGDELITRTSQALSLIHISEPTSRS